MLQHSIGVAGTFHIECPLFTGPKVHDILWFGMAWDAFTWSASDPSLAD